jgi:hypothetical protein
MGKNEMRQLKLMVDVITSPKITFKNLPSDKIYILAILVVSHVETAG